MFAGTAATKSTLVKRGPNEQSENADNAAPPPSKRMKVEGGISDLDDEIKRNFEKGTVSKVRNLSFLLLFRITLLTGFCWL